MKCEEIFAALALLEKERGIPQDFMLEKIVQALVTAYKRDHEDVENVVVDVNEEKHDLKMFVEKTVVEEVENPAAEISAEEAKAISAKYHVGDTVRFPVKNVDFGRIAAGNGKQVIIQGLREAEHGMIYDEFNSKQHEILTATVLRVDPRTGNATVRLGSGTDATDAVLTLGEQVNGEEYYEGQILKVYLVEVRRGSRGPQMLISRTHPGLDEHAQIIMIERSGYVSYANCGLPYYVGGVIKGQAELTLQTPESFWDRFRIDVRVRQEVTAINPAEKTVTVHALDSGKVYTETYDKLLLAPGAKPTVPALSGVSSERVFTLRTVEDTLRIRRFVEDQKPKTAVLAGGGFIGLEMAENLAEIGVSVTIVQRPKQLLAPLDANIGVGT